MTYKFFDKRFLVFPDEDCLGKKVFFADSYKELLEDIESGDSGKTRTIDGINKSEVYPFDINDTNWTLAYYDPNYEAKVAYSQGKQIQYKLSDGAWEDVEEPSWYVTDVYRIKPESEPEPKTRRFTNRELAEWGASNKGQILYLGHAHTTYYYLDGSDDETVADCIRIRAWSETEWHEPLVEMPE